MRYIKPKLATVFWLFIGYIVVLIIAIGPALVAGEGELGPDGDKNRSDTAVSIRDVARLERPSNIAPLATVTASSQNTANNQLAVKAVDGIADGFPKASAHEWATDGQTKGAWLHLQWPDKYLVDRIILYDRPNENDRILDAFIDFSDGSRLWVGPLNNAGRANEYTFDAKLIQSLTLTVFKASKSSSNIGLAEIEVFGHLCTPPYVRIGRPHSYALQTSSKLYVTASACLQNPAHGVRFLLDGGTRRGGQQADDYTEPHEHTFQGLIQSEHTVDVHIIDASGTAVAGANTHDQVVQVGIGDYLVAFGDSITYGYGGILNTSADGRNTGKGFEPLLNDLLTSYTGIPHTVVNEGVSGQISAFGASEIDTILAKYPDARQILVQWGTNDADPVWYHVPSGLGLNPGQKGYAGSFKDHMQQIITAVKDAGKEICLAKLPIVLADSWTGGRYPDPADPEPGTRGYYVIQYNQVIDELYSANDLSIVPMDFWTKFNEPVGHSLHRYDLEYYDRIHPNSIGYGTMAKAWYLKLAP